MRATARAWGCAIGVVASLILAEPSSSIQAGQLEQLRRGRELFERVWEPKDAQAQGDGLGPMFNARSCVACHFQGGIGGGGPPANNVDLLTAQTSTDPQKFQRQLGAMRNLHAGFNNTTSIVLHRFSTGDRYAPFRAKLLGVQPLPDPVRQAIAARDLRQRQGDPPIKAIEFGEVTLLHSQRSTTPLFGARAIDNIPTATIEEIARQQPLEDPNVSGRFIGRFGWRGQVANLAAFVRGACAVELGLQTGTTAQAMNPVAPGAPGGLDLSDQQCGDLTEFVASLPQPRRLRPRNTQLAAHVNNGEALFETVGCTVCHRPRLGYVRGIYSDLLVHNMGSYLEDPAPAGSAATTQYYGPPPDNSSPLAIERRREWKTPPLWGLADSAPYLHDGRAATIDEAITYHSGEAAASVDRYRSLTPDMRARLLLFLSTLTAPDAGLLANVGK